MSVGERDYVREVLSMLQVPVDFWRVAMKPGKPLAFGVRNNTLVFGLPGNPISAMVTFELFVRPALRKLQALSFEVPQVPARLKAALSKPAGLHHFVRARTELKDGTLWAEPLKSQTSGALVSAVGATHLISVPPETTALGEGEAVSLIPVSWVS
jgi:molybdopterin molybdotransferase